MIGHDTFLDSTRLPTMGIGRELPAAAFQTMSEARMSREGLIMRMAQPTQLTLDKTLARIRKQFAQEAWKSWSKVFALHDKLGLNFP